MKFLKLTLLFFAFQGGSLFADPYLDLTKKSCEATGGLWDFQVGCKCPLGTSWRRDALKPDEHNIMQFDYEITPRCVTFEESCRTSCGVNKPIGFKGGEIKNNQCYCEGVSLWHF